MQLYYAFIIPRSLACFTGIVAAIGIALPSEAQSTHPLPPDSMVITPGGVDLQTGTYKWNKNLISIGKEGQGGLNLRRLTRSYSSGEREGRMGQFNHNWDIRFKLRSQPRSAARYVTFTSDEISHTFLDGGVGDLPMVSDVGYATMVRRDLGGKRYYTLTMSDGTVVRSSAMGSDGNALAESVERANGVQYALAYDTLGPGGEFRLRRIISNAGYALLFQYNADAHVTQACAVNLTTSLILTSDACPLSSKSVYYEYSGGLVTSETDPTGSIWRFESNFTYINNPFSEKYFNPGESSPYLTLNYDFIDFYRTSIIGQKFLDGRIYSYVWSILTDQTGDHNIAIVPATYDEDNGTVSVDQDVYRYSVYALPRIAPGPSVLSGAMGTFRFDWCLQTCAYAMLRSKTDTEGIRSEYTYDLFRNVKETRVVPKPGSGLATKVYVANFDCTTTITNCTKPTYKVDPQGNRTDYTYDIVHGGPLTVMLPADVMGIRPVKRYAYTQGYAWTKSTGGGYTQVATPIWLLSEERTCRTTATSVNGCVGGSADEVVMSYQYQQGSPSTPSNLLLLGVAVTADGQTRRTCYGYDDVGNRLWETKPRADLASCL